MARAVLKPDSSKLVRSDACTSFVSSRSVAKRSKLLSASSLKLRGRRRMRMIHLAWDSDGSEFLWLLRFSMVGDKPGS